MIKRERLTRGITLIALVVTIVVLLILAGITIALVFGQNGVIKRAQDSKEQTAIGEMRDKLEMAKLPVFTEGNGSYNVQDYWDRIESEGLIAEQSTDKIDNGDGTYDVTTTPGYVFEITVEPNEEIADNIIIGDCIGKGENLKIGLRVVNKTTNSIEVEVVRAEGTSDFKYSIKKQGEEYGSAVDSNDTTYTFSGLTQGGIYTIKVEATIDGEQQEVERTVQVGEIPKAIYGEVTWTGNGQASVRIYTNETGYQLEWQKNGISEGSWTRENAGVKEVTIPNLTNGDNIYARLYDGVSSGDWANVQVMDNTPPEITKFEVIETTTNSIKVEVEARDDESGIATNETYEYYLGEELKTTSTNNNYTFSGLTSGAEYILKVTVKNGAGKSSEKTVIATTNKALPIEDVLKEGNYVNYVDAKGITRKCVVLYDDNSPYGIEIIFMDIVENVELGNGTGSSYENNVTYFNISMNSYNNAISTLNSRANEYNNSTYSTRARCVGSVPDNINSQSGMYTIEYGGDYSGKLRDADNNYLTDWNKMNELKIFDINKEYWLASRAIWFVPNNCFFGMSVITQDGTLITMPNSNRNAICLVYPSGTTSYSNNSGLRPVFHLKSGIKVIGGEGTSISPYELGV